MDADADLQRAIEHGYFWPAREAVLFLNERLNLPASGMEQDWEVELIDYDRLSEFMRVLGSGELDFECRSALALTLTCAVVYGYDEILPETADELRRLLQSERPVLARMHSYWGRTWAGEILPDDEAMWRATTDLLGDFVRHDPFNRPGPAAF